MAKKKLKIIKADYAALELRMLAHLGANHEELNKEIGLKIDNNPLRLILLGVNNAR